MLEKRLEHISDEFDPRRCQASTGNGQCPRLSVDDTPYCQQHQGGSKEKCNSAKVLRNYRLSKWKFEGRMNEFADNPEIKSLREEIGIMRVVMEETLGRCEDSQDLLLYSSRISDHILKIQKLVEACHKLEQSTGNLLDKTTVLQLADTIVATIGNYIQDPAILDKIGGDIVYNIMSVVNPKPNE